MTARADGGVTINGRLDGNQFALAFPKEWTGDGLLYAHGYSPPGTPVAGSADPVDKALGTGALGEAYGQGFAVGHSAYAKDGLGAEAGTKAIARLRDMLAEMGGKRIYVMGDSMGGGIVVTLLEMYPKAFAGGFARCGVVASWEDILGRIVDMRLAYNALTKDTPYALPGNQDVRHDALSSRPPAGTPDAIAQVHVLGEIAKVGMPPLALWCVQMPSVPIIQRREERVGVPVVSAAVCTTHQMLDRLGLERRLPDAGALLGGKY